MGVFFVDVHSKTVFSSFIGCILIRLYWLEDMMHKNPFKDVCFLYQYVSKLELNNQGVALHLFRASKYIGKIRLSNSIQTFFTNMSSVIVMSCLSKYYLLKKNVWTKRVYKSTVACVNTDKELTELLFKFSSDRNKNIYDKKNQKHSHISV